MYACMKECIYRYRYLHTQKNEEYTHTHTRMYQKTRFPI